MTARRLGLLLLVGAGRRGLTRFLLLTVGTSIGICCLFMTLALPQVVDARQERFERRIPVTGRAEGDVRYHSVTRRVGPHALPVVFLTRGHVSTLPPGVEALPEKGEAVVSPALAEAIQQIPGLDAVMPYRVAGTISDVGLTGPDEWYAYVTVDRGDLPGGGRPLAGFGADINPEVDLSAGDVTFVNLSLLGVVGVPLLVYFAITARLSAATRLRRLAVLRLLGMTIKETQRVNAVESSLGALSGTVVGLGLFALLNPVMAARGVAGLSWFSVDSSPARGLALASLVAVPVLAGTISRIGSRSAVRTALASRRQAPPPRHNVWRLIPLLAGSAILCALIVTGAARPVGVGLGDSGALLLMVGVVLTGIGLVLGFEVVPSSVARVLARRFDRVPVLLGMRRLEFEPASASRVVAGLVVVIFVMGFATGIQRDARASSLPMGTTQLYDLSGRELNGIGLSRLGTVEGVTAVAARAQSDPIKVGGRRPSYVDVTWVTCAHLGELLGTPVPGCTNEGFTVVPTRGKPLTPIPPAGSHLRIPGLPNSVSVTVPDQTIRLPLRDVLRLGNLQVVLSPGRLPQDSLPRHGNVVLASPATSDTVRDVTLGVAKIAPHATINFLNANFDQRRRAETAQGFVSASVVLGLLIGIAAFLVASLDRIVERRRHLVALTIVGVPRSTQRLAQVAQLAVLLFIGFTAAVLAGTLVEQATVMVGGIARGWRSASLAPSLLLAVVASVVAIAGSMVAMRGDVDVSLIREE